MKYLYFACKLRQHCCTCDYQPKKTALQRRCFLNLLLLLLLCLSACLAFGMHSVCIFACTCTCDYMYVSKPATSSPSGGGSEPLSLMELCVRAICRRLSDFRKFPSLLPREVVDALLQSLTQVRCAARRGARACLWLTVVYSMCVAVRPPSLLFSAFVFFLL